MSKMSQAHAELAEKAAELGFQSIEEAEANGYVVKYNLNGVASLEPDVDEAHRIEKELLDKLEEGKKVEIISEALRGVRDLIGLLYKPYDKPYVRALDDITDKKIQDYYFKLNNMIIELTDRNVMRWQQEDK